MEDSRPMHRNIAVVLSIMRDIEEQFPELHQYRISEDSEAHRAISHGERLLRSIAQAMDNVESARAEGVDVAGAEADVLRWRARIGIFVHDCMLAMQYTHGDYKKKRATLRAQYLDDLRAVATSRTSFAPYGWYVLGVALWGTHDEYMEYEAAAEALRQAEQTKDEQYAVLATRKLQEIEQKRTEAEKKKGGCFVATAAFGSPLATEVFVLRRLRDEVLALNAVGRLFVRCYYRISPPMAVWLARGSLRRRIARCVLAPIVGQTRKYFGG